MTKPKLGLLVSNFTLLLALFAVQVSGAQHRDHVWSMVSDHPAGTVAGGAIQLFAAALSGRTLGVLTGKPTSLPSTDLIAAVQQGRVQIADVFAGSLTTLDPIFELPTLPFIVDSVSDAERLECLAEPTYRRQLSRAGLHLLFVSPWPPTGLWSRRPVKATRDVTALRVRTYDDASSEVLESLGARAAALPVQDVGPLLRAGGLDAVLSSGDGSVGKVLGEDLANFSAIRYAYPVSFVVMNQSMYEALPEVQRRQVDAAAMEVARQQWRLLPARIRTNYAHMQNAGVVVTMSLNDELQERLHGAGQLRVQEWLTRVPADYAEIIKAFRKTETLAADDRCKFNLLEARNSTRG